MAFIIKKLEPLDVDLARQLFMFFQTDDAVADPVTPSDEYLRMLLLKNEFHVLVALQNNCFAGGLTAYELPMYKEEINEMFLYEIAVVPEYRQMGVAKSLIESLKDICINRHIKEMYVGTSTDNDAAVKLYKSGGGRADDKIAWFVYSL